MKHNQWLWIMGVVVIGIVIFNSAGAARETTMGYSQHSFSQKLVAPNILMVGDYNFFKSADHNIIVSKRTSVSGLISIRPGTLSTSGTIIININVPNNGMVICDKGGYYYPKQATSSDWLVNLNCMYDYSDSGAKSCPIEGWNGDNTFIKRCNYMGKLIDYKPSHMVDIKVEWRYSRNEAGKLWSAEGLTFSLPVKVTYNGKLLTEEMWIFREKGGYQFYISPDKDIPEGMRLNGVINRFR